MTKEEATKILARMLEADANDTFLAQSERSAVIYALQEMNGAEKKVTTHPKADPPKTWIRASEINEKIREEVNMAVAEALKKEHDKRLLEAIREIVSADFFREMVDCLVFRAEKRREGAKDDE